jgi:hypothetical protein
MARRKGAIRLVGKFVSRQELLKKVSDRFDNCSPEMLEDIINLFFSPEILSKTLKTDHSISIPGSFTIRIKPEIINRIKRNKKLKLKRSKKKYLKKHPEIRKRRNPYMKRYMQLYQHNKWREINGLPKKNRRIRKNSLLFRTMPSMKKIREMYPEYFKTWPYQKRRNTWKRKKEEGLNYFDIKP